VKFGRTVRSQWRLDEEAIFLNHGSFGATPIPVLEVQADWQKQLERQPVYFMERTLIPALREAAGNLGSFIGAEGKNIAFVDNATTGVNAVVRSLKFEPGDEILTTNHVYGAVRKALAYVADRSGAELVEVVIPFPLQDPQQVIDAVTAAVTERTRLAVFDHITSPTALILPLETLIQVCKSQGIPVLVDGAHAPGMIPLQIETLGADWYTGNCHKWLCAPKGCAFLWTSPERQATTHPTTISHGYKANYLEEFDWTGTRDPSTWLAVTAAIDFQEQLGVEAVRTHNFQLARRAGAMLAERWGTSIPSPDSMIGSMVTVLLPPVQNLDSLHRDLWDDHRIEVPIIPFGETGWLRISAQVYNEFWEYERLAEAVVGYAKGLSSG
jgi:isopenicillin-N epimerase